MVLINILPSSLQITKLEKLGNAYDVKIIFLPKFHSEMSAIEGVWCHLKTHVRKYSQQNFPRMINLVAEARDNFVAKDINKKLQRRFWKCLESYGEGKGYQEVLCLFLSHLCKSEIKSHRKIVNTKIDYVGD